MFIDYAKIFVKSGKGGDGKVSFHTAKYVPNGGPDGGDGGDGGSVIFKAVKNLTTLQNFRYKRKYIAQDGEIGGRRKKFGKKGEDLIVEVPIGTIIKNAETMDILADLTEEGEEIIVAKGGKGGLGNIHFANSVRQAPNFAKAGEEAEEFNLLIELKLLADVGLIGLPNVGKSSLLSVITSARPKIADYHFTTVEPNIGICVVDDNYHFAIADIPGLIEGASIGLGLGHDFLKHIERTKLLVHLVDVSGSEGRDPIEDFELINKELAEFSPDLANRPQIVVASKIDLADEKQIKNFEEYIKTKKLELYNICAPIHEGTEKLVLKILELLKKLPDTKLKTSIVNDRKIYKFEEDSFEIKRNDDTSFTVSGLWIKRLMANINFEDIESLNYFQRQLKSKGVFETLEKEGCIEGDLVYIDDFSFEYIP